MSNIGRLMTISGAVLLLAALLLGLYDHLEDERAGRESEKNLALVESAIESGRAVTESENEPLPPEMPTVMIDGCPYVGYIDLPRLSLTLPVIGEWNSERLNASPCRQFGSSRTGDLVIAGHNFRCHFGRIGELKAGDAVFFTDMDGITSVYSVEKTETLDPDDAEYVRGSGYALVLYTCTFDGSERIGVFCIPGKNTY